MTKVVKEYVERKIREGAQPNIDKLEEAKMNAVETSFSEDDLDKTVFGSKEYKAVDALIKKVAKEHGLNVAPYYKDEQLLRLNMRVRSNAVTKADNELKSYRDKVNNVVQESLVAIELSKSKDDVDQLIAKAIANLV